MQQHGPGRLEVTLAQALLNEIKYGSELVELAEVLLLAAFQQRRVGSKLVEAMQVLLPGLRYCSVAAVLKDGVLVRSSNLMLEGQVKLRADSLRGSAARVAARKHTMFHSKRRPGDEQIKYYELQEAWQQTGSTSLLAVPIPAVRSYESASLPGAEPKSDPDSSADPAARNCPVLHNLNGAVGIICYGLYTEQIQLGSRQGKHFVSMAHCLAPFLGTSAQAVLQLLDGDVKRVAAANAAVQREQKTGSGMDDAASRTSVWSIASSAADQPLQQRPSQARLVSPFSNFTLPADSELPQQQGPKEQEWQQRTKQQLPAEAPAVPVTQQSMEKKDSLASVLSSELPLKGMDFRSSHDEDRHGPAPAELPPQQLHRQQHAPARAPPPARKGLQQDTVPVSDVLPRRRSPFADPEGHASHPDPPSDVMYASDPQSVLRDALRLATSASVSSPFLSPFAAAMERQVFRDSRFAHDAHRNRERKGCAGPWTDGAHGPWIGPLAQGSAPEPLDGLVMLAQGSNAESSNSAPGHMDDEGLGCTTTHREPQQQGRQQPGREPARSMPSPAHGAVLAAQALVPEADKLKARGPAGKAPAQPSSEIASEATAYRLSDSSESDTGAGAAQAAAVDPQQWDPAPQRRVQHTSAAGRAFRRQDSRRSMQARYSTSTYQDGQLHLPSEHFPLKQRLMAGGNSSQPWSSGSFRQRESISGMPKAIAEGCESGPGAAAASNKDHEQLDPAAVNKAANPGALAQALVGVRTHSAELDAVSTAARASGESNSGARRISAGSAGNTDYNSNNSVAGFMPGSSLAAHNKRSRSSVEYIRSFVSGESRESEAGEVPFNPNFASVLDTWPLMHFKAGNLEDRFWRWHARKQQRSDGLLAMIGVVLLVLAMVARPAVLARESPVWPLVLTAFVLQGLAYANQNWYLQYREMAVQGLSFVYMACLVALLPTTLQQPLWRSCEGNSLWWWLRVTGAEHLLLLPLGSRMRLKKCIPIQLASLAMAYLFLIGRVCDVCQPDGAASLCVAKSLVLLLVVGVCTPTALLSIVELRNRRAFLSQGHS